MKPHIFDALAELCSQFIDQLCAHVTRFDPIASAWAGQYGCRQTRACALLQIGEYFAEQEE